MLSEFLTNGAHGLIRWSGAMPGVRICQFELEESWAEKMRAIPIAGVPGHFETFFCQGGSAIAERMHGRSGKVEAENVFLLSDVSGFRSFKISGDLKGILVSVDGGAARGSFFSACSAMGLTLDTGLVKERMDAQGGCFVMADSPWTHAAFRCLASLPDDARGQYCVFKAVELLYLLCTRDWGRDLPLPAEGYVSQSILDVKQYMETHLSEKITIPALSRRFSLSPTSLKADFRRTYGQPIHRWLIGVRMKHAAELIRSTGLSNQEIAQAVGYEGVSQFNAAFKRHYGTTPGRLRKMSKAAISRLF